MNATNQNYSKGEISIAVMLTAAGMFVGGLLYVTSIKADVAVQGSEITSIKDDIAEIKYLVNKLADKEGL